LQKLHLSIKTAEKRIPVYVGQNLWEYLVTFLSDNYSLYSIYVITDSNVGRIYQDAVRKKLGVLKNFKDLVIFPAGEASKTRREKDRLEDILLKQFAGRDSLILAMGGGVTGDLAGYVASSLHRGIPLIHIPTSLLAFVDSSIGGKVGINHPLGKNLIGSFSQPRAIFVDVSLLETLPTVEYQNGMAEVIKYAVILNSKLWKELEDNRKEILAKDLDIIQNVITRCIKIKIQVVEADEEESGYRSVLNFGHTIGHAIEQLAQYNIKHGYAISEGMVFAAGLSHKILNYAESNIKRLKQLLERYYLNFNNLKKYDPEIIWETICRDKKARQQTPRFTLIDSNNEPSLFYPVTKEDFISGFESL
jgi:3-dehydroquinate synthase